MRLLRVLLLFFLAAAPAVAQKHELSVTAGGQFPINATFDTGAGFAVEGSYAGRIAHVPLASLYVEIPVAAGINGTANLPTLGLQKRDFSSLFVAPGLKLKLIPELPVSPYFAAGVGVAHFRIDATSTDPERTDNSMVVDFAAGLDMKIAPFVSLRGEVRDFYSGNPFHEFGGVLTNIAGRQHNVFTTAGIVLRF